MWDEEATRFSVLANALGQFSLWPESLAVPAGWTAVGPTGSRQECSEYVDQAWLDMRPHEAPAVAAVASIASDGARP